MDNAEMLAQYFRGWSRSYLINQPLSSGVNQTEESFCLCLAHHDSLESSGLSILTDEYHP